MVNELLTSEPGALTSVHESVLARSARLDAEAREVLDAASLLSDGAPVSVLSPRARRQRARDRRVRGGWASRSRRPHPELSTRASAASRRRRDHADAAGASASCDPRRAARCRRGRPRGVRPPRRARWRSGGRARVRARRPHGERRCSVPIARPSPSTSGHCASRGASRRSERAALLDEYTSELLVVNRNADALEASTDAVASWRAGGEQESLALALCRRARGARERPRSRRRPRRRAVSVRSPGGLGRHARLGPCPRDLGVAVPEARRTTAVRRRGAAWASQWPNGQVTRRRRSRS